MNESAYLGIIPILFTLLFITMYMLLYVFIKEVKIFKKALYTYIFIAMLIVLIFSFIYILVFSFDLSNLNNNCPNILKDSNISIEEKQKIFNSYSHFKGINVLDYIRNFPSLIIDMIYFSTMTFFTVGYGDMTIGSGVVRLIPIIEGALGVAMTGIIISMILSNSMEISKNEDTLRMFISRGYDILSLEKTSIESSSFLSILFQGLYDKKVQEDNKYSYNVHLMDPSGGTYTIYYINLNNGTREMFENFIIKWDFANYRNHNTEYYYKFAKYLEYQLDGKLDLKLKIELLKFTKTDEKINLVKFQQFLENLKKELIEKPIDEMKNHNELKIENEMIRLSTQCINSIIDISFKATFSD